MESFAIIVYGFDEELFILDTSIHNIFCSIANCCGKKIGPNPFPIVLDNKGNDMTQNLLMFIETMTFSLCNKNDCSKSTKRNMRMIYGHYLNGFIVDV